MRIRWLLIFFLIFSTAAFSQKWEIGVTAGGTNYLGDLAPNIVFQETKSSYGFFIKRNLDPFFSHNLVFMKGSISGNDQNFNFLKARNLNFFSEITELSYILEFNFFRFAIGLHPNKFTPYAFLGLGSFYHQPKTTHNGTVIILGPLDTEGIMLEIEKRAYRNLQICVPMGGGFKFKLSKDLNLAVFVGYRRTFTDYLDDVSTTYYNIDDLQKEYGDLSALLSDRSEQIIGFDGKQRGRPDMKDWFMFGGASISFKIKNKVCFEF